MEIEFNENGCGNMNLRFPDTKSVQVMPEKTNYTLDKVYPPDTQQVSKYHKQAEDHLSPSPKE